MTWDFLRDDGTPVTVDFSYRAGSETTYSPLNGACGGDPCEVEIECAWERLGKQRAIPQTWNWYNPADWFRPYPLTDEEHERFSLHIAENHIPDFEDYSDYEEDFREA